MLQGTIRSPKDSRLDLLDSTLVDPLSEMFRCMKNAVIDMEVNILYELGYQIQRFSQSPHKFLLFFAKTLKCEKEVVQTAWNFANDLYLGSSSIHYPPELLAASCVYLSYRSRGACMPRVQWWILSDYSFGLVEEAARDIHKTVSVTIPTIDQCKVALDKFYKMMRSDTVFDSGIGHMYKLTDRQMLDRVIERIGQTAEERKKEKTRSKGKSRSRDSNRSEKKKHKQKKKHSKKEWRERSPEESRLACVT